MEHGRPPAPMPEPVPVPRRYLEKLRAKREAIERRRNDGSVDSADDEDDELGLGIGTLSLSSSAGSTTSSVGTGPASSLRQHFRSKSVLPSSKLGVEMMRANSHDSVTVGNVPESTSSSTIVSATHAVTPTQEETDKELAGAELADAGLADDEPTDEDHDDEADTTIIHTPPDQIASSEDGATVVGVDETPRPAPSVTETSAAADEDPTPRPRRKAGMPVYV